MLLTGMSSLLTTDIGHKYSCMILSVLQIPITEGIEDNSKIIFFISQ